MSLEYICDVKDCHEKATVHVSTVLRSNFFGDWADNKDYCEHHVVRTAINKDAKITLWGEPND